ncbi:MAG: CD1375 family protein [Clostridia bacterium]
MINLYCTLIINKRRSFGQIPDNFKVAVEARLLELGYEANGDSIAKEV